MKIIFAHEILRKIIFFFLNACLIFDESMFFDQNPYERLRYDTFYDGEGVNYLKYFKNHILKKVSSVNILRWHPNWKFKHDIIHEFIKNYIILKYNSVLKWCHVSKNDVLCEWDRLGLLNLHIRWINKFSNGYTLKLFSNCWIGSTYTVKLLLLDFILLNFILLISGPYW